jgi:hypothetical protein
LGGICFGYVIIAAAAGFVANLGYQALQAQVFDEVVAGMIGAAAVYCLIGVALIATFSRTGSNAIRQHAAARANEVVRSRTSRSISEDAINA